MKAGTGGRRSLYRVDGGRGIGFPAHLLWMSASPNALKAVLASVGEVPG